MQGIPSLRILLIVILQRLGLTSSTASQQSRKWQIEAVCDGNRQDSDTSD